MIAGVLVAFIIENASSQFVSGTVYEMTGQAKTRFRVQTFSGLEQ